MGTTVMAMLFCEVFGGRLRAFEGRQGRNAQEPELKSGSQRTLRWREMDSNFQYAGAVNLAVGPFEARGSDH
jgi:hypothetical protein